MTESVYGDAADLVVAMMERNARDVAWVADAVQQGLQDRLDRAEAQLMLITDRVTELCSQEWTPATWALMDALRPAEIEIASEIARIRARRG